MATLLNSTVGSIKMGRTCASSNSDRTVRLGACIANDGGRKTAVGMCASYASSGDDNTAFGYFAHRAKAGYCNIAIGGYAMCASGGGHQNVAIGGNSLFSLSTGTCNLAIGYNSLCNLTTGSCNVAIGFNSGTGLYTGNKNVFVGAYARPNWGSVCCSVVIGYNAIVDNADFSVTIGCGSNNQSGCGIIIGCCISNNTNDIFWGNSSNNQCNCVWGSWTYASDCRDKAEIVELNDNLGINLIRKLKPVSYRNDNRESYVKLCNYDYGTKDGNLKVNKRSYGLIAQDVKNVVEELNVQFDVLKYNSDSDAYKLSYSQLIASIVKTIKTIDERIETLKSKI